MRSVCLIIFGMLTALSNCSAARGQGCSATLQPHFAIYHSASISGSTIYTTLSIQGYTSIYPNPGCPMTNVTHKVGAYNQLSSTGGWSYSSSGCPTCYFSTANNEQFVGVPGVVYSWNWQGTPICSIVGPFAGVGGGSSIPDVSVSISQRGSTSETVSGDNVAITTYNNVLGTTKLGAIFPPGPYGGRAIGYETIGFVTPSIYAGNIILHRWIVGQALWTNSSSTPSSEPPDDTSPTGWRDDNPQSGGSAGKVYDLDGPLLAPGSVDGNTYRARYNFYAYATLPDGITQISPNYYFFVRLSCTKTAFGYQFVSDVTGDNQISSGTTPLTWNLH